MGEITYDVANGVAYIALNRPAKLNTVNPEVLAQLGVAVDRALVEADVNSILLYGKGESFCAGYDLDIEEEESAWEQWLTARNGLEVRKKIWHAHKPVVAAVHGYALGEGFELANLADLVIAAEDAVFGEPELRYSYLTYPVTVYLVGLRHIKEVMMLGEHFTAAEAHRVGLVNRVVPRGQLMPEASRIAAKLARMPERTMRLMKHMLNKVLDVQGFTTMQEWGSDLFALSQAAGTPEAATFKHLRETQGIKAAIRWAKERFGD